MAAELRRPFSLVGRRALVTGASKGIGAACARALDAAGARVALVARSADRLANVAAALANDPVVLVADLAEPGAPEAVAAEVTERLGGLDVLVNNAASAARLDSLELDGETIDRLYHLNVRQLLLLTTALLPTLVESGHGSVVNLSSVSGVVGTPRRAAYAATKGAVDAATRSLAVELGPRGVRLNSVAPGCIVTDLWERNRAVPGVVEQIEAQTALRRWGEPEDVADVVVFLASNAARYVTGVTVPVDGGMATTIDLYGGAV
ncbi:MAG: glucose 1-dehydrogenase [Acidimicrobiia bacterium]|nr:glucose 1-dehydrogenase [Acidimicrobiia bacterium]